MYLLNEHEPSLHCIIFSPSVLPARLGSSFTSITREWLRAGQRNIEIIQLQWTRICLHNSPLCRSEEWGRDRHWSGAYRVHLGNCVFRLAEHRRQHDEPRVIETSGFSHEAVHTGNKKNEESSTNIWSHLKQQPGDYYQTTDIELR